MIRISKTNKDNIYLLEQTDSVQFEDISTYERFIKGKVSAYECFRVVGIFKDRLDIDRFKSLSKGLQ